MKLLSCLMLVCLAFSCQSKNDSPKNNPDPAPKADGSGGSAAPTGKTLNFDEIIQQDLTAKENLNWGNSESFPFKIKRDDNTELSMVKLSYFLQENKLVKSKDIEKTKGYCELSATTAENANGSEINLVGNDKLFQFGDYRSEKAEINNLNYSYRAVFKLSFQNSSKAARTAQPQQFELECFNVLDLSELKATVDTKFTFTKKEAK